MSKSRADERYPEIHQGPIEKSIQIIDNAKIEDLMACDHPVILKEASKSWNAIGRWTPEFFASKYADCVIGSEINLPTTGVPSKNSLRNHQTQMRIEDFVELMLDPAAKPCYIHQKSISWFPGIENDIDFSVLSGGLEQHSTNLWIGSMSTAE